MYDWQKKLLTDMDSYAKSGKELKISMVRQTGKTLFSAVALKRLMDDLNKPQPVEELVYSEGRVHGCVYHCVEPIGGSWIEMGEWCNATFGEPGEIWLLKDEQDYGWPEGARWYINNRKFWFRSEKDKLMFTMRWSR